MANKLVLIVGEHPNEATALYLGRKAAEELERRGYDVSVERMPLELTFVGSVVKGLPPVDVAGHATHFSWLEKILLKHGNEAFYLHFHNSSIYGNPSKLRDLLFLNPHFPTGGVGIEIPAIFKQTKNKRLLERAQDIEDAVATVADFKSSSEHGLVEPILPHLVSSIEDYVNGRLLPVDNIFPINTQPAYDITADIEAGRNPLFRFLQKDAN